MTCLTTQCDNHWIIGCASHKGARIQNEDHVICLTDAEHKRALLVLADGMGGHDGGATGAKIIIETAESLWKSYEETAEPNAGFLTRLVARCHEQLNLVRENPAQCPRSTIAALLVTPLSVDSIHVGDTRIYQFDGRQSVKRTYDHSVAQTLALQGKIADADIKNHPKRSQLFTSIGGPDQPMSEIETWDVKQGNQFVLCSDGLWQVATEGELISLFATEHISEAALRLMEQKCKTHDDLDNMTLVAIELLEQDG